MQAYFCNTGTFALFGNLVFLNSNLDIIAIPIVESVRQPTNVPQLKHVIKLEKVAMAEVHVVPRTCICLHTYEGCPNL